MPAVACQLSLDTSLLPKMCSTVTENKGPIFLLSSGNIDSTINIYCMARCVMAEREQIDMKPDLFITQQVNMVETKKPLTLLKMTRVCGKNNLAVT